MFCMLHEFHEFDMSLLGSKGPKTLIIKTKYVTFLQKISLRKLKCSNKVFCLSTVKCKIRYSNKCLRNKYVCKYFLLYFVLITFVLGFSLSIKCKLVELSVEQHSNVSMNFILLNFY